MWTEWMRASSRRVTALIEASPEPGQRHPAQRARTIGGDERVALAARRSASGERAARIVDKRLPQAGHVSRH